MEFNLKKLWDLNNLRSYIILSFSLLTFLTFVAPLRKRTAKNWIILSLWTAYLNANLVVNYAAGIIFHSQSDTSVAVNNRDLQAFWATFLLVHLGGPDTITALALEDNEIGVRYLLVVITQSIAAAYVFIRTFHISKLWMPTMLVFVAGMIKYYERTRSMYLASLGNLRESTRRFPDSGDETADLLLYTEEIVVPQGITVMLKNATASGDGDLTELALMQHAYYFFNIIKVMIVDSFLSFAVPIYSRDFFLTRSAEDAFRMIELELNLIYEFLYTKVSVVHCKSGYICKFVSFISVVVALALFYSENKQGFLRLDVGITYLLLLGAIALDLIAIAMLFFSNWAIIALIMIPRAISDDNSFYAKMLTFLLSIKKARRISYSANRTLRLIRQFLYPAEWSESVSQFNLINYCIHTRSRWMQKLIHFFHLTSFLDRLQFVKRVPLTRELRDFIFNEMLIKAKVVNNVAGGMEIYSEKGKGVFTDDEGSTANDVAGGTEIYSEKGKGVLTDEASTADDVAGGTEIYSEKGKGVLSDEASTADDVTGGTEIYSEKGKGVLSDVASTADDVAIANNIHSARGEWVLRRKGHANLLPYVEVEYDRSLILWHIATELCYSDGESNAAAGTGEAGKYRDFSKLLSDYMLYLLVMDLPMMSTVAGHAYLRFMDTCAKTKQFLQVQEQTGAYPNIFDEQVRACRTIMSVQTPVAFMPYINRKSVLFDACPLAKELQKMDEKDKWETISSVWVELLSYAASRCGAYTHAQRLNRGGELITLVWLLMVHLGLHASTTTHQHISGP